MIVVTSSTVAGILQPCSAECPDYVLTCMLTVWMLSWAATVVRRNMQTQATATVHLLPGCTLLYNKTTAGVAYLPVCVHRPSSIQIIHLLAFDCPDLLQG
jgi:hypothetical protein